MDRSWESAVLERIKKHGGRSVALQDIYACMEVSELITPYHKKPWRFGCQPRYQCWIRRCLTNLVRKDLIERESIGIYSINSN